MTNTVIEINKAQYEKIGVIMHGGFHDASGGHFSFYGNYSHKWYYFDGANVSGIKNIEVEFEEIYKNNV